MCEDHVELGRRILEAIGRRDVEFLGSASTPGVEWHSIFAIGEAGAYVGPAGTQRYMRDLDDAWEVGVAEVDDGLSVGNVGFLVGRIRGRGKGSGAETTVSVGWVMRFTGGKLASFQAFQDPAAVLATLGRND